MPCIIYISLLKKTYVFLEIKPDFVYNYMMLFVKSCFTGKNIRSSEKIGDKMELNKQNVKKILGIITFAIVLLMAFQHYSILISVLSWIITITAPLTIGICVALMLNVPMRALEKNVFKFIANSKRNGVRKLLRPVSLISTIILTVGFIALLILIILPQLKNAVVLLINKVPYYIDAAIEFIEPKLHKFGIEADLSSLHPSQINISKIQTMLSKVFSIKDSDELINTTVGVTSSLLSGVVNFALGVIIAIYFLVDKERIIRFISRVAKVTFPDKVYSKIHRICTVAETSFSSFITGQFTDSTILGFLCFIGMTVLRLPSAAVVAVTIGITSLIPVIGPFIGETISFIIIFIESPLKAVFFLIFILTLQTIDNNLIYPRVVGKSVGLPGFVVLIAVIVGGNIGGIVGILLGVPVASAIYILVFEALREKEERRNAVNIKSKESNKSDESIMQKGE